MWLHILMGFGVEHPWSRFWGGWLCRVVLSNRHLPSDGDVFPVCDPTWPTSELEIISGGVFIWFQRGMGLGFETVFPAKLVFPPPPLPNFHSVSQTVTPLLLGSSQRNLAVPFNSTKGLDQRSLIIYSNGR